METLTLEKMEIFHKDFNLDKKHNLDQIPEGKGVFGIFGIVNSEPINCRFIAQTTNLRKSVQDLYENPPSEGLKKFMCGPWIQMLVFETFDKNKTEQQVQTSVDEWIKKYEPKIDDEGEYPGYYDY